MPAIEQFDACRVETPHAISANQCPAELGPVSSQVDKAAGFTIALEGESPVIGHRVGGIVTGVLDNFANGGCQWSDGINDDHMS